MAYDSNETKNDNQNLNWAFELIPFKETAIKNAAWRQKLLLKRLVCIIESGDYFVEISQFIHSFEESLKYGIFFSRKVQIALFKFFTSIAVCVTLDEIVTRSCFQLVRKLSQTLSPLVVTDLEISWELFFNVEKNSSYMSKEYLVEYIEFLRYIRNYFAKDSIKLIWSEFRSKLYYSASQKISLPDKCFKTANNPYEFFPVNKLTLKPILEDILPHIFKLWYSSQNESFQNDIIHFLGRISRSYPGRINWLPHLGHIYGHLKRYIIWMSSLSSQNADYLSPLILVNFAAIIVDSHCQEFNFLSSSASDASMNGTHFENFIRMNSHYHENFPKNSNIKILSYLYNYCAYLLSTTLSKQLKAKPICLPYDYYLKPEMVDKFVKILQPIALEKIMYSNSRVAVQQNCSTIKWLATLRPKLIMPKLIDTLYANKELPEIPLRLQNTVKSLKETSVLLIHPTSSLNLFVKMTEDETLREINEIENTDLLDRDELSSDSPTDMNNVSLNGELLKTRMTAEQHVEWSKEHTQFMHFPPEGRRYIPKLMATLSSLIDINKIELTSDIIRCLINITDGYPIIDLSKKVGASKYEKFTANIEEIGFELFERLLECILALDFDNSNNQIHNLCSSLVGCIAESAVCSIELRKKLAKKFITFSLSNHLSSNTQSKIMPNIFHLIGDNQEIRIYVMTEFWASIKPIIRFLKDCNGFVFKNEADSQLMAVIRTMSLVISLVNIHSYYSTDGNKAYEKESFIDPALAFVDLVMEKSLDEENSCHSLTISTAMIYLNILNSLSAIYINEEVFDSFNMENFNSDSWSPFFSFDKTKKVVDANGSKLFFFPDERNFKICHEMLNKIYSKTNSELDKLWSMLNKEYLDLKKLKKEYITSVFSLLCVTGKILLCCGEPVIPERGIEIVIKNSKGKCFDLQDCGSSIDGEQYESYIQDSFVFGSESEESKAKIVAMKNHLSNRIISFAECIKEILSRKYDNESYLIKLWKLFDNSMWFELIQAFNGINDLPSYSTNIANNIYMNDSYAYPNPMMPHKKLLKNAKEMIENLRNQDYEMKLLYQEYKYYNWPKGRINPYIYGSKLNIEYERFIKLLFQISLSSIEYNSMPIIFFEMNSGKATTTIARTFLKEAKCSIMHNVEILKSSLKNMTENQILSKLRELRSAILIFDKFLSNANASSINRFYSQDCHESVHFFHKYFISIFQLDLKSYPETSKIKFEYDNLIKNLRYILLEMKNSIYYDRVALPTESSLKNGTTHQNCHKYLLYNSNELIRLLDSNHQELVRIIDPASKSQLLVEERKRYLEEVTLVRDDFFIKTLNSSELLDFPKSNLLWLSPLSRLPIYIDPYLFCKSNDESCLIMHRPEIVSCIINDCLLSIKTNYMFYGLEYLNDFLFADFMYFIPVNYIERSMEKEDESNSLFPFPAIRNDIESFKIKPDDQRSLLDDNFLWKNNGFIYYLNDWKFKIDKSVQFTYPKFDHVEKKFDEESFNEWLKKFPVIQSHNESLKTLAKETLNKEFMVRFAEKILDFYPYDTQYRESLTKFIRCLYIIFGPDPVIELIEKLCNCLLMLDPDLKLEDNGIREFLGPFWVLAILNGLNENRCQYSKSWQDRLAHRVIPRILIKCEAKCLLASIQNQRMKIHDTVSDSLKYVQFISTTYEDLSDKFSFNPTPILTLEFPDTFYKASSIYKKINSIYEPGGSNLRIVRIYQRILDNFLPSLYSPLWQLSKEIIKDANNLNASCTHKDLSVGDGTTVQTEDECPLCIARHYLPYRHRIFMAYSLQVIIMYKTRHLGSALIEDFFTINGFEIWNKWSNGPPWYRELSVVLSDILLSKYPIIFTNSSFNYPSINNPITANDQVAVLVQKYNPVPDESFERWRMTKTFQFSHKFFFDNLVLNLKKEILKLLHLTNTEISPQTRKIKQELNLPEKNWTATGEQETNDEITRILSRIKMIMNSIKDSIHLSLDQYSPEFNPSSFFLSLSSLLADVSSNNQSIQVLMYLFNYNKTTSTNLSKPDHYTKLYYIFLPYYTRIIDNDILTDQVNVTLNGMDNFLCHKSWNVRCVGINLLFNWIHSNSICLWTNSLIRANIKDKIMDRFKLCLNDQWIDVYELTMNLLSRIFLHNYIICTREKINEFKNWLKDVNTRQVGVLCLCAVILAHPYSTPSYLPDILSELSRNYTHSRDKYSILVKKTLNSYKKTHQDDWDNSHKIMFTEDQLLDLQSLTLAPLNYI